jgi:single-strand DNA-binding protein
MPNYLKIIAVGYLTRDPEMRYTAKGTAVAQCGLAVNRTWTNEAGEKKESAVFLDFKAWGRVAENLNNYCRKGNPVLLDGRMDQEKWTDKASGQPRSRLVMVAEAVQFLGAEEPARTDPGHRPVARSDQSNVGIPDADEPLPGGDDDVPF